MTIRTVLGDVVLDHTGIVLPHEHLVIDYRQKDGAAPPPSSAEETHCVELLRGLRVAGGVQAIVDCTPPGYGRDIDFLRRVSERSGVHIVASTGSFCEQLSEQPSWASRASVDALEEAFSAELSRSCGVIKVATSSGTATQNERKAMEAASRVHLATGAPIVSHTSGSLGIDHVDIYESLGVDLSKVLISHVCAEDEPVSYAIEIASRGARVGFDRIGHASHSDAYWISLIQELLDRDLGDRILLSHDSVQRFTGPDAIADHKFSAMSHIPTTFRTGVASAIAPAVFSQLTIQNPLLWLAPNRDSQ